MNFFRIVFLCLLVSYLSPLVSDEAKCEVYFSPKDHLAERLIELIHQEKKSIKIAVYCMTHTGIAKALIDAQERGVNVEMIIDPFSVKTRSCIHKLVKAEIPLFVWDPLLNLQGKSYKVGKKKDKAPIMHDKFCVFGDNITWTGSFNFTHDGNFRNEENAVIIESKDIAKKYLSHYADIKVYGCRPFADYLAFHPKKRNSQTASLK